MAVKHAWRFLRTIRHFSVSSLLHRLRLRLLKRLYNPATLPGGMGPHHKPAELRRLQSFDGFAQTRQDKQVLAMRREALYAGTGRLLNRDFVLPHDLHTLQTLLQHQDALWREAMGYLDFLLPLLQAPQPSDADLALVSGQLQVYWQLSLQGQRWSTYGVARRLLTYAACWPHLDRFPAEIQERLLNHCYSDARYVGTFLEWDVRGNHLVKDLKAWLAAALQLESVPAVSHEARRWRLIVLRLLPGVLESQVLADGFHFERTPMYHLWVLADLLDCLAWLKTYPTPGEDDALARLEAVARRMITALGGVVHTDGRVAPFGDSSLPQTPDASLLREYGAMVLEGALETLTAETCQVLPDAGFALVRHEASLASLVLDFGDFGPRDLPAHSHADLGSFEVQVGGMPLIVDAGISGYEPGPMRDYERGAAAHNTLWVPGEDMAELWGSFRVAEYPAVERPEVETDPSGQKITLSYENHNHRYHHQRSLYAVGQDFWVIQDWIRHLSPAERPCYSLLHVPTEVDIVADSDIFTLHNRLLVIPFGAKALNWTGHPDWEGNRNQLSPGFHMAAPSQLIALAPSMGGDCFGWVLVPYSGQKPLASRNASLVSLDFGDRAFQLGWDSSGLSVAVREPAGGSFPG